MDSTVDRMTLQALLEQHGIHTIREFARRMDFSRQQAWDLWHAKAGVGVEMLKRLHERLNIPLEELIQLDPVRQPPSPGAPQSKPRRRK